MSELIRKEDAIGILEDFEVAIEQGDPDAYQKYIGRMQLLESQPSADEAWKVAQRVFLTSLTYEEGLEYVREHEERKE